MTLRYQVPSISCGHCKQAIESGVTAVAGVSSVQVDIEAKTVTVEGAASATDVAAAISAAGYDDARPLA